MFLLIPQRLGHIIRRIAVADLDIELDPADNASGDGNAPRSNARTAGALAVSTANASTSIANAEPSFL
jgi:hypothetical protein